ncbi:hypothetical protein [Caudoviricetes sp.]|nr:hypothetical protein [Caudoviricetes sp.]
MALTQDQINKAYADSRQFGTTDEDLTAQAKAQYGLTDEQIKAAQGAYNPTSGGGLLFSAPQPTAADQNTLNIIYEQQRRGVPNVTNDQLWNLAQEYGVSREQFDKASGVFDEKAAALRRGVSGWSMDQILNEAQKTGVSASDLGLMFGEHGGTGSQVTGATGYGSEFGINRQATEGWKYDPTYETGWFNDKGGGKGGKSDYQPVLDRTIDYGTETIEGRIGNLLGMDSSGNYANPVVRQAAENALKAFNARGLLNSSMAQQAAYQAAIAKAIEIAGPDAQTYFSQGRANQDASNLFARDQAGYGYDLGRIAAQGDQAIRSQNNQNTFTAQQSQLQRDWQSGEAGANRAWQTSENNSNRAWQTTENAANRAAQLQSAEIGASKSLQAAQISSGTQLAVAEVNRKYGATSNLSSSANSLMLNFNSNIAAVATSDLPAESKDQLITYMTNNLKSGITLQGMIAGDIDLSGLTNQLWG